MQSFTSLELELLKSGYVRIAYVELYCPRDGGWRCATVEAPLTMGCPHCGLVRRATAIALGFTRSPGQWERWESPLSPHALSFLHSSIDEAERFRNERKRRYHERPHFNRGSKIQPASSNASGTLIPALLSGL